MTERNRHEKPSSGADASRGDHFSIGDISNSKGVAVGHGATAIVNEYGSNDSELAEKFLAVYKQIDERFDDPNVEKHEIKRTVKNIEQEVAKDEPNKNKIDRWLRSLKEMAPDILKVTLKVTATILEHLPQ